MNINPFNTCLQQIETHFVVTMLTKCIENVKTMELNNLETYILRYTIFLSQRHSLIFNTFLNQQCTISVL